MIDDIKKDANHRMQKTLEALKDALQHVRTGRAHPALLEHVMVDYYGSQVPLPRAATVAVEDARTLTVSPWEKAMVPAVEKAIITSDLGLTPVSAGTVIRIPLPPMTEERRKDLVKVVRQEGEGARVALRNVRRDALGSVKELLKEKLIGEDDDRRAQDEIQKLTDSHVAKVDGLLKEKESEIMEF